MAFPIQNFLSSQNFLSGQNFFNNSLSFPQFGGNAVGGNAGFAPPSVAAGPQISQQQVLGFLQMMLGALTQLSQAWGGFGGAPQPAPQPSLPSPGVAPPSYTVSGLGGGAPAGYGGNTTGAPNPANYTSLPPSSDPQDFASYLQAQLAGGTLQGNTSISQADAIPGSRFARVESPQLWHSNVARNYAYQFAAFASGNDALSPEGMKAGVEAFHQMNPESRLFMQVASVFKGNMFQGPGFYDNPGLQKLLQSRGVTDLAGLKGVGETDVQTIGAVAQAINRGQLSLDDVIQSGTIDNLDRYFEVINYVQTGRFALDTAAYDQAPI